MKAGLIFIMILAFASASSAASTLTMKKDSSLRQEKIQSMVVEEASISSLTIYSETMSCKINNLNLEEALSLQAELSAKTDVQVGIRCFGKAKNDGRGLGIETSKYNLGNTLAR